MRRATWSWNTRGTLVAVMLAGFLVSVPVLFYQGQTNYLSPWDEPSHFDYVLKIAQDHRLPVAHEPLSNAAAELYTCSTRPEPNCWKDSDTPYGVESHITAYLPTYYVPTAIITWTIHSVARNLSWLDAAQLSSLVWLIGLTCLLVLIAKQFRAHPLLAVAIAVAVGSMPILVVQSSAVTNDLGATAFAAAAVWAWLVNRDRRASRRLVISGLLALAALTSKETGGVAVAAVALMELDLRMRAVREVPVGPLPVQADPSPNVVHPPGSISLDPVGESAEPAGRVAVQVRTVVDARGDGDPEPPRRAVPRGRFLVPLTFCCLIGAAYVLVRVLDPAIRGQVPPTGFLDALIASTNPQSFSVALAAAYDSIANSFAVPSSFPGYDGVWLNVGARWAAFMAIGGMILVAVRQCPLGESGERALHRGILAFIVILPPLLILMLRISGPVIFWQARYFLPSMVLALTLVLLQWRASAAGIAVVLAGVFWLFTVFQMATIDEYRWTHPVASAGQAETVAPTPTPTASQPLETQGQLPINWPPGVLKDGRLAQVALKFGTYEGTATGSAVLRLSSGSRSVWEGEVDLGELTDNEFKYFEAGGVSGVDSGSLVSTGGHGVSLWEVLDGEAVSTCIVMHYEGSKATTTPGC